jgi:hypothetical protein
MFYDSLDNMGEFNKGDNPHLFMAFGADQRVNLIYFLNQACPVFPELFG